MNEKLSAVNHDRADTARGAAVGATVLQVGLAPVIGLAACIVAASLAVSAARIPSSNGEVISCHRFWDRMPADPGDQLMIVAHPARRDGMSSRGAAADADVLLRAVAAGLDSVLLMSPMTS